MFDKLMWSQTVILPELLIVRFFLIHMCIELIHTLPIFKSPINFLPKAVDPNISVFHMNVICMLM